MSEENKIEKSAEEVLADVVKSEVASVDEKIEAVKTSVESLEIPSTEGFLKSEDLDGLNNEIAELKKANEELVATVKSAPAIIKGDSDMGEFIKWSSEEVKAESKIDLSTEVTKAFNSTTNITGAPTASQTVYYAMQQMNPYRAYSTVMPTGATAVNLPQVTSITAQAEANIPATINTGSGHGGTVASAQVIPHNWVSRTVFSDQSVEDLPSLDPMVAQFMAQQIAVAEASDMVTNLDAATVSEVNTGVAANLPSTIDPWADLVANLSSAYKPNAKFIMSRNALAHLRSTDQAGTGSDLIIDPSSGNFMLWGYEIIINDHMDAGTTAGDNAVYFGDFRAGTIIVSRKEMSISRHEDTIPGGVYFYGNMRSRGTVWDANALVRFNTGA